MKEPNEHKKKGEKLTDDEFAIIKQEIKNTLKLMSNSYQRFMCVYGLVDENKSSL